MSFISTYNSMSARGYQSLLPQNFVGLLNFSTTTADLGIGSSLSLSNDNNYLAVGAPGRFVGNTLPRGRVYIFKNNNNNWQLETDIQPTSNVANAVSFGGAVALNNDASYLVAGSRGSAFPAPDLGRAWVFTRSGNVWSEQQQLIPSISDPDDFYGLRVAINDAGDKIAISAIRTEDPDFFNKVFVFTRSGNTWTESAILQPSLPNQSQFGDSLSMDSTGNYIVVGAPTDDSIVVNNGLVYVYNNEILEQTITANNSPNTNQQFGSSVSINSSGDRITISSRLSGENIETWTRSGNIWSFETSIQAAGSLSMSLSPDGNLLVCRGPLDLQADGRVYEYVSNSWTPKSDLIGVFVATNESRSSSAISDDGSSIFMGFAGYDIPTLNIGTVGQWRL